MICIKTAQPVRWDCEYHPQLIDLGSVGGSKGQNAFPYFHVSTSPLGGSCDAKTTCLSSHSNWCVRALQLLRTCVAIAAYVHRNCCGIAKSPFSPRHFHISMFPYFHFRLRVSILQSFNISIFAKALKLVIILSIVNTTAKRIGEKVLYLSFERGKRGQERLRRAVFTTFTMRSNVLVRNTLKRIHIVQT
jgi:hypothetical protein